MPDPSYLSGTYFAVATLVSGTVFTFLWLLDSVKHGEIANEEITKKELQTHRNILMSSLLMELSLVTMYWWQWGSLPFFIAFFVTRSAHEFIDELHWHAGRCSHYESMLHLGMWVSILSQTFVLFTWGFFTGYKEIWGLSWSMYVWGGVLFLVMSYTSAVEWRRTSTLE